MEIAAIDKRIVFHDKLQVMEVDFSDITFDNAEQVHEIYDQVHKRIKASGRDKWYFLVKYKNCKLTPLSWIPFANRGKKVNIAHSLGSVRYDVDEATRQTIEGQAKAKNFDSNVMETREIALERLAQMRQQSGN